MGKTRQKSRRTATKAVHIATTPPRPATSRKAAIPLTAKAEPLAFAVPVPFTNQPPAKLPPAKLLGPRARPKAPPAQSQSAALRRAIAAGERLMPDPEPAQPAPLPRSRSLAVPRRGLLDQLSHWIQAMLPKKPRKNKALHEVELTRRKLKDLRRQIMLMERTLERLI